MFISLANRLTLQQGNQISRKILNGFPRALSLQAKLEKKDEPKIDVDRLEKIKIPETKSFVQNLYAGKACVDSYFPYPQVLNEEELSLIDMVTGPVSKMWEEKMPDILKIEQSESIPEDVIQTLKEMGSFGIQASADYGGIGCNNTQYARLSEISGQYDLGIGIVLGAHQSIGYKGLLLFGTPEQKDRYLPELASGQKIACFCLTEPSAGSDASGIKTRAEPTEDGKYWILNGSKIWISNGGIADYFTVFAQTPCKTANGKIKDKVTAFWVHRGPGVTNGPNLKKMGIKLSNTTEVWFDNVKVPSENIIGQVGEGFKVAMNILNNGRYGMCCALSGTMRKAIGIATEHANNRTQFGNKLSTYTGIQEKIARMTMAHYVTQSHAYMLSGVMDNGMKDFQLEAAIAKIIASESAWYVVDETIQILGGMGYMQDTGVEKLMRDVRIFRIFEGTNDILRLFIALTGLQYAGGHLKELQKAMKNPVANLGMLVGAGSQRLRRSVGLDAPDLRDSAVEHLLVKYTSKIVMEQIILNRVANSVIDIYSMLVLLSRATNALNKNLSSAEFEEKMCKAFCAEANMKSLKILHQFDLASG
uniref:Very long-chain specific acyl-CoA dehydrogenase, mitochondrial n=1 Tax=Sarcoptes scabiei TaxID=52283 RepID=A0A834V7Z4_SARSC